MVTGIIADIQAVFAIVGEIENIGHEYEEIMKVVHNVMNVIKEDSFGTLIKKLDSSVKKLFDEVIDLVKAIGELVEAIRDIINRLLAVDSESADTLTNSLTSSVQ